MESNTTDSGSRVTRSLRKRLTSVDSDNSSRPGTPVASKLSSITEITASPSRSTRSTRRNSTSGAATPVKTPGKRVIGSSAIITENADLSTPARRSARRRSISANENEETHQLGIKVPAFQALTEENISTEINCTTTKRITRSQSKSPQQQTTLDSKSPSENSNDYVLKNDLSKRRKPGPKCKTQKRDDADSASDVEISVQGKDDESNQIESTSMNIKKKQEEINLTRGQSSVANTVVDLGEEKPISNESESVGLKLKENDGGLMETIKRNSIENEGEKKNEDNTTPHRKYISSAEMVNEKNNDEGLHLADYSKISVIDIQSSDAGANSENQKDNPIVNISKIKSTGSKLKVKEGTNAHEILKSSEPIEIIEEHMIPQTDNKMGNISINSLALLQQDVDKENLNISSTNKPSSKKVDFILSPSNNVNIKNVYPKTPASTKTKISFLEVESSHIEDSLQDSRKEQIQGLRIIDKTADVKEKEVTNTGKIKMTPKKTYNYIEKLPIVQSSTPLNLDTSANAERQANESENTQTDDEEGETRMKWINPSVKATTMEGSKLDKVVLENVTKHTKSFIEIESENQNINERKKKSIVFTSDDDDEGIIDQQLENDDEFAVEEEEYRKHDFHDDEAMEVDDYESGDSMDSEERKEMIDNEVMIDGESIGSHTTDGENNECIEEEGNETDDSFIVSDNEEVECLESDDHNELEDKSEEDEDLQHNNSENKKTYKRLQLHSESSSSDDEVQSHQSKDETEKRDIILKESNGDDNTNQLIEESKESIYKNLEENSIASENEDKAKVVEVNQAETNSPCNILSESSFKNLLDSSKLSDSALRLQCISGSESEEEKNSNISHKEILRNLNPTDQFNKSVRDLNIEIDTSSAEDIQSKSSNDSASDFIVESKIDKLKKDNTTEDVCKNEVSVSEIATHSNDDKENTHEDKFVSNGEQLNTALSASLDNSKKTSDNKGRKEWQRSFTIDVTVKGGQLDTNIADIKPNEISEPVSVSSSDVHDFRNPTNDDVDFLENLRHMPLPLGNPLFRSRRQSLALPTNPNMEICSLNVKEINAKSKRMSLGILSNSDLKPSQSFIDSIELQNCDHKDLVAKRKRLSKSFCGASDTLDNSVVDIDVRPLHKRSKVDDENSMVDNHNDSSENINTTKLSTKISSTPHEKSSRVDSNNSIQLILNRCDEILEAANRAKLEAKIICKKSKQKLSKKQKKRLLVSSDETKKDDVLRKIPKEIKHKDKIKTAVTQAIKTADKILKNKRLEETKDSKRLPSDVLEEIRNIQVKGHCYQATAVGNFVEMPQSPEKRKKRVSYIQLPTGKVSVEPVTPKKRLVQACNGTEFRESPVSPHATGFKVREIPLIDKNTSAEITSKVTRKKRYYDETFKQNTLPKPQWTQSGTFLEEEIPIRHQISCADKSRFRDGSKKFKKNSAEHEHLNTANWNFKQKAMMRPDIKRSTNREALLLRERRYAQGRY